MTKLDTGARPWTDSEDAILGTNTLVKIAASINRPTSQLQKRMKQLGIPPFGPRFKPRSPARAAEEQAIAERNKVRFDRSMRVGMDVAVLVASGRTVMAAAQELGIGVEACRQRLLKFIRLAGHPARFGEVMSPATDWRKIEPYLLNEAVRRMKIELESGARDVWSEPVSASFSEK